MSATTYLRETTVKFENLTAAPAKFCGSQMSSSILSARYTYTHNASPHLPVRTVLYTYKCIYMCMCLCMYIYIEKRLAYRNLYLDKEAFCNTKCMVTNNPTCYSALTIRLLTISPHMQV